MATPEAATIPAMTTTSEPDEELRRHLPCISGMGHAGLPDCDHMLSWSDFRERYSAQRIRGRQVERLVYLPFLDGWRRACGLSRAELARWSGVHARIIRALEQQRRPTSLGTLRKLAEALNLPNWILLRHQPPASRLPADHALGRRYYITLDDGGALCFKLPWLHADRVLRAELSLDELAARTGIAAEEILAYEQHRRCAPMAHVERLAAALGVTALQLISE